MSITSSKLKEFHQFLDKVIELQEEGIKIQLESREIFVQAVQIMRDTGLGDFEISELVREYLRNRIPKSSLNKYLSELKPELEESTSQSGQESPIDDKNDTEQESETPAEITVTTEGSQSFTPPLEEEPSPLELAEIKIKQLEDALKKTEQFKPASVLQPPPEIDIVNNIVVRCGIEKIEALVHNEMAGMRNRGWKAVEVTMRAL